MATKAAQTAVEVAEPVLEEMAQVLDETVDTVARIPQVRLNGTTRGQQIVILGVTAAVGAAVGGTATYFYVRKRMRTEYEKLLAEETESIRKYYRVKRMKRAEAEGIIHAEGDQEKEVEADFQPPEVVPGHTDYTAFSKTPEEVNAVKEKPVDAEIETPEGMNRVGHNVFTDSSPVGPFDIEVQDTSGPHVISWDDFMAGQDGFEQVNLVYFARDDMLVDEMDEPIANNDLVGEENLKRFGHGSKDNNTVFVRNPKNKTEYQIIRSMGSFAKEAHGFDDSDAVEHELRHSDRRHRRMRPGDD